MKLHCHICGSRSKLHRLPKHPKIAEKWKQAIPYATRSDFSLRFRVCILHFNSNQVFDRRHIVKWAVPELTYFNGRFWQKEVFKTIVPLEPKVMKSNMPPIVIRPAPTNVEEKAVVLPLPPRRDDEPDSDPLALPDQLPIISHVTSLSQSLRHQFRKTSPSRSPWNSTPKTSTPIQPQWTARPVQSLSNLQKSPHQLQQGPQNLCRLKIIRSESPVAATSLCAARKAKLSPTIPSTDSTSVKSQVFSEKSPQVNLPLCIAKKPPIPIKPKITVKSSVELSTPQHISPVATQLTKGKLQVVPNIPSLVVLPPPKSAPTILVPHQAQSLILPNQMQLIISQSPDNSKIRLGSESSQPQLILTPDQGPEPTLLISEKGTGHPFIITNNSVSQQVVSAPGTSAAPIVQEKQSTNLQSASKSRPSELTIKVNTSPNIRSPPGAITSLTPLVKKKPTHQLISSTNDSSQTENKQNNSLVTLTSPGVANYSENLTRNAIAITKADIDKCNQRSLAIEKKIDLLKLKVTTYEGLIARLVTKKIISKESAKICRVLEKDVIKYSKKRKLASEFKEELSKSKKQLMSSTVFGKSPAKDHDYL